MATPTRVKVAVGYTVAMGDFEFVRFDFGLEEDVPEGMTRAEVFDKSFNWTWNRLDEKVVEARKAARG
jgi:hypothetical protein